MEWLRDAEAARMARAWAREVTEGLAAPMTQAETLARLEEEALGAEVTGWAQEAALKAYALTIEVST